MKALLKFWEKYQEGLGWAFIITLLFMGVIAGANSCERQSKLIQEVVEKDKKAFMDSCQTDRKYYECITLWNAR